MPTAVHTPTSLLESVFGHTQFRGRQAEIIQRILSGEHALVIMPTGMGKSLCYQVPAILLAEKNRQSSPPRPPADKTPLTLVISPLIALMKDQVDALNRKGVYAAFINSSLHRAERANYVTPP